MNDIPIKVFHANGCYSYSVWIPNAVICNDIKEADVVIFEGGEDIHPSIYGDVVGEKTYYNIERDIKEVRLFKEAMALKKPILGICRGAQLACALSGGKLVQHQDNSRNYHSMLTAEGNITMNSYHHQAQYPYNLHHKDYKLLGWTYAISEYHLNGKGEEMSKVNPYPEAEICFYPRTNALAIQGHPEMLFRELGKIPSVEKTFMFLHDIFFKFVKNTL